MKLVLSKKHATHGVWEIRHKEDAGDAKLRWKEVFNQEEEVG